MNKAPKHIPRCWSRGLLLTWPASASVTGFGGSCSCSSISSSPPWMADMSQESMPDILASTGLCPCVLFQQSTNNTQNASTQRKG
eukprot:m.517129 g.517129  ORF g.517129 m.517129 type:complete len:85 (-) comp57479_c0_seq27:1109-1363(-)